MDAVHTHTRTTLARTQARDSLMPRPNPLPPKGGACVGLHLLHPLPTQGSKWIIPPITPPVPDLTEKQRSLLLSGESEIMTNRDEKASGRQPFRAPEEASDPISH